MYFRTCLEVQDLGMWTHTTQLGGSLGGGKEGKDLEKGRRGTGQTRGVGADQLHSV